MCQSKADGGQRCAAHTRPRYEAATFGTAEWDEAAGEYAASPTGRGMLMLQSQQPGAPVERQVALMSAIRRGDVLRGVAVETRTEIQRASENLNPIGPIPRTDQMKAVKPKGSTMWVLHDDTGRAYSADSRKVFKFHTKADAENWKEIATRPAWFNKWIPADTKTP